MSVQFAGYDMIIIGWFGVKNLIIKKTKKREK